MREVDWAYLAGFLDGEGCISARKRAAHRSCRPQIRVTQSDHLVMMELHDLFEVGNLYVTGRGHMVWSITAVSEVKEVLVGVMPYLRLKQGQAAIALRLCDRRIRTSLTGAELSERLSELKQPRRTE